MVSRGAGDRMSAEMDVSSTIYSCIGRRICRVGRIFFRVGCDVQYDAGPIELTFDSDKAFVFDVGSDGERLRISSTSWDEYFEAMDALEKAEGTRSHDRWVRVSVSGEPKYRDLVARTVDDASPIESPNGKITGIVLRVGGTMLRVDVVADEIYVDIS